MTEMEGSRAWNNGYCDRFEVSTENCNIGKRRVRGVLKRERLEKKKAKMKR